MHTWILWNDEAGRSLSRQDLQTLIERAGHTVVDIILKDDLEEDAIDPRAELVVAAGGDGTVATAAGLVAGTALPLAILPLGTANNIARSLGLSAPVPQLVGSWATAARVPFDLGCARSGNQDWLVVEGIGGGLMPAAIEEAQRKEDSRGDAGGASGKDDAADEVLEAVRTFRRVLEDLEPARWSMVVDGEAVTGSFLAVEILNIRSIGPNLVFSAGADPTDGQFDVVLAGPGDRAALLAYLDRRLQGQDGGMPLPVRRAREIWLECSAPLHIDDERVDGCPLGELTVSLAPARMTVLL